MKIVTAIGIIAGILGLSFTANSYLDKRLNSKADKSLVEYMAADIRVIRKDVKEIKDAVK